MQHFTVKFLVILLIFSSAVIIVKRYVDAKKDAAGKDIFSYIEKSKYEHLPPVYQQMMQNKLLEINQSSTSFIKEPYFCWAPDTDPKILDAFQTFETNLRHSLWHNLEKFQIATRWSSTATNGGGLTQGDPTTLTWSYPPDGTTIFSCNAENNTPNDLIAFFNALYGSPTTPGDYTTAPWHQIFIDMFDDWSSVSGLTFVYEPNDDGANFGAGGVLGVRGDIRIGGHPVDGNSGILACNQFPNGGDMVIDTDDNFYSNNPTLGTSNVLAHEVGHGLGFAHVCPVEQTKLMEPLVSVAFDGPQEDDVLAVNRSYGDVDENNDSSSAATDLGTLSVPSTTSRTQRSVDDNSDIDFYTFSINDAAEVTITMTPTGTSYDEGPQVGNCDTGANFNASTVANLEVALIASDGTTILENGNITAAGTPESVNRSLAVGTYFVRVQQSASVDNVQMYEIEVVTNDIPTAPPVADFTFSPSEPIQFCAGTTTTISFIDASTNAPNSWAWDFSGVVVSPTTSTAQNPTVTVASAGTLMATLVATNSAGTSPSFSRTIVVEEIPASDPVCQGAPCLDFTGNFFLLNNVTPSCATGCTPVSRAQGVHASEAYYLAGLTAGEEYTFSICNGYDAANWEAVLTIGQVNGGTILANSDIAFSGGCSVTFTCPSNGDYACVITEKDNCGGAEIQIDNGTPTLQCSGLVNTSLFTDPGGSTLDYFNNTNQLYTLCPSQVGQFVEVTFFAFDVEGDTDGNSPTDCYDILNIYDGDDTAAPQIGGEYCNTPGPGSPGTVISTAPSGCLTFEFISDQIVTAPGWEATVRCTDTSCPPSFSGGNALVGIEDGTGGTNNDGIYETDGIITSTQTITNGSVNYDSGTEINLNAEFEVVLGAVFHAFIDGCGGSSIYGSVENKNTSQNQKNIPRYIIDNQQNKSSRILSH